MRVSITADHWSENLIFSTNLHIAECEKCCLTGSNFISLKTNGNFLTVGCNCQAHTHISGGPPNIELFKIECRFISDRSRISFHRNKSNKNVNLYIVILAQYPAWVLHQRPNQISPVSAFPAHLPNFIECQIDMRANYVGQPASREIRNLNNFPWRHPMRLRIRNKIVGRDNFCHYSVQRFTQVCFKRSNFGGVISRLSTRLQSLAMLDLVLNFPYSQSCTNKRHAAGNDRTPIARKFAPAIRRTNARRDIPDTQTHQPKGKEPREDQKFVSCVHTETVTRLVPCPQEARP